MKDAVNDATSKLIIPEVRFTAKDDDLFAYICSWSGKEVLIKSLSSGQSDAIKKVELLDSGKKAIWKQTSEGLVLSMPSASGQPIYIQGFRIKFQ
jgi:alpha-L-fucosidase